MLERFGATLRSAAVWEDPPDDLGDRIVAQVNTLRAAASSTDPSAPTPTPTPPPPASLDEERRRRHGRGWLWPGLAVAAAALVAFAAGALLTGGDDDQRSREPVADVELTPTDLGAGGIGRRHGRRRRRRILHQHRRRRPAAGAGGGVLRGLVARHGDRRLGQRRHVPHARRRRPSGAVVRGPDRSLPGAGRHLRGRRVDRRRPRRHPPRRPAPAPLTTRRSGRPSVHVRIWAATGPDSGRSAAQFARNVGGIWYP